MDLRSSSALKQIDNAARLMIRDIAIYTGQAEEEVIDEYFHVGNPSIFMQVATKPKKYPVTTMLARMLKKNHTEGRFNIDMISEEEE